MLWVIYNILSGQVYQTQMDEPLELGPGQCKARCSFLTLGQEKEDTLIVSSVDLDTLEIRGISISKPLEKIQELERNITNLEIKNLEKTQLIAALETNVTDLEISNVEKDNTISILERSITDLEIAVLELKAGGTV